MGLSDCGLASAPLHLYKTRTLQTTLYRRNSALREEVVFICKLYYTHPWLQELDTKILSHHNEDDQHLVVLEETIFYPTGGGQPHDLGTINGVALLDVFEKDGVILHRLEQALQGDSAFCVLDWPRRLDHAAA